MIQTKRLYYDYPVTQHLSANIEEVRPLGNGWSAILLDATIFYPEGGGQPCDWGMINGTPLLDVREKNGEILHLIRDEEAARFSPGPAELFLDVRRRRDHTVCHTGQHLLSGTILALTGKYTVSMHMGDEVCTIDVDAPELTEKILVEVEEKVFDAIEENTPVITHLCPPEDVMSFPLRKQIPQTEEVIRVVEIKDCDFSPCCGTHLRSTAEIGMVRILGAEKYKGMTRVTFIAGRRCLRDSRALRKNVEVISHVLSVPAGEVGNGVLAYIEKIETAERIRKAEEEAAAEKRAEELVNMAGAASPAPEMIIKSYSEGGIDQILRIGKLAQKRTGAILVLASERDAKFAAFCGARGVDIRPLLKEKFDASDGRGGGGPSFFQGSFKDQKALAAFIEKLA